jgi:hypothetical protein
LLRFDGKEFMELADCRQLFPTATALTSLFYVSGDGQVVTDNLRDPKALIRVQPLQVRVTNGSCPVEGAKVRFHVTRGKGQLQGRSYPEDYDALTGSDGVAECAWEVDGETELQQVDARLLDAADKPINHLLVRFSAFLTQAAAVIYNSTRKPLKAAAVRTVQGAIDQLCDQLSRLQ